MRRIVLAALALGLCASLAASARAQTNQMCMLRCLDHTLYQICKARCTKPAPPGQSSTQNGVTPPATVPPAASTPPSSLAAPAAAPTSAQPAPMLSAPQPALAQPMPQPSIERAAQPTSSQPPPQPAAQPAPRPAAPPARPVNEACVLRCLDHGRLYGQCEAVCAH